MNGILPLWKPKGLTSHDCVQRVRKIFETRKVGHTGTLDPEVEGVLVICIGDDTKLVQYLTKVEKTYIARCSLGVATETEDQTGKIIEQVKLRSFPTSEELTKALNKFKGESVQIPPMYSAVRVRGKRLYEYARNNEEVERPRRKIFIHNIELENIEAEKDSFSFKTTCSSGTYIRTLCVDLGKELGYPAHMSNLVRIETSNFTAEETITFEELMVLKEKQDLQKSLETRTRALKHFDGVNVDSETKRRVAFGQKLPVPNQQLQTEPFKLMYNNEVIALYKFDSKDKNLIRPERVFQSK